MCGGVGLFFSFFLSFFHISYLHVRFHETLWVITCLTLTQIWCWGVFKTENRKPRRRPWTSLRDFPGAPAVFISFLGCCAKWFKFGKWWEKFWPVQTVGPPVGNFFPANQFDPVLIMWPAGHAWSYMSDTDLMGAATGATAGGWDERLRTWKT